MTESCHTYEWGWGILETRKHSYISHSYISVLVYSFACCPYILAYDGVFWRLENSELAFEVSHVTYLNQALHRQCKIEVERLSHVTHHRS